MLNVPTSSPGLRPRGEEVRGERAGAVGGPLRPPHVDALGLLARDYGRQLHGFASFKFAETEAPIRRTFCSTWELDFRETRQISRRETRQISRLPRDASLSGDAAGLREIRIQIFNYVQI